MEGRTKSGLDTAELFAFIGSTQIEAWSRLIKLHGGDPKERKYIARRWTA